MTMVTRHLNVDFLNHGDARNDFVCTTIQENNLGAHYISPNVISPSKSLWIRTHKTSVIVIVYKNKRMLMSNKVSCMKRG